jgi:PglZ domain
MSAWVDRILKEFTADLSRFWIAADPDDVLLDERVLSGLRERGFELLRYDDSIAFRAEYEERYRPAWDHDQDAPTKALVLHLRGSSTSELPWDYLSQSRKVSVSLANLFPKLSYAVVRQLSPDQHEALFDAHIKHASQVLGESATKEFVLTHIYKISPHLIARPEDLWRELLRLHYIDAALPCVLAEHVAGVLSEIDAFKSLPLRRLFESKAILLRSVQDAWYHYLSLHGVTGTTLIGEATPPEFQLRAEIPFEHPDVRVWIDSMFLDGLLHPLTVQGVPTSIPEWAKVGIVQDPLALRTLVEEGIKAIKQTLPDTDSSYRDWINTAQKFGEILGRYHSLDASRSNGLKEAVADLQLVADQRLFEWTRQHYADLSALPIAKGPVMVHHIPRYLARQRSEESGRVALLVFDGLAIDQWVLIRESLAHRAPLLGFNESACFAWMPTLTSVSRQAIFSGLKPREFADTIETTGSESAHWNRFWQDQGLTPKEIVYKKGLKRIDQLDEIESVITDSTKVVGLVIDTVDEIVHGAVLGKRGIAAQIESWCDSGFVDRLIDFLLSKKFVVYLTADHGNVEAVGQGRPKQGLAAEMRGERVRIYRNEEVAEESMAAFPGSFRLPATGLPSGYMALYPGGRSAFTIQGEQSVVHGGISIEELLVPFIKIINKKNEQ